MARRVDGFKKDQTEAQPRRYPWAEWTDESVWEIRQGEDYTVATENMRVNLHERAKQQVMAVRTEIVRDESGEGLRFQFRNPQFEPQTTRTLRPITHSGMSPLVPHTQQTRPL